MSGQAVIDLCPFCNAPWGTCDHFRLLGQWEEEALDREAVAEAGPEKPVPDKPEADGRFQAGKP